MDWDKHEREVTEAAAAAGMKVLAPEEDEPCFAEIEKRAEARLADLGDEGDGPLIRELLAAMRHYEAENHQLYWQMSDNGELVGTEP